MNIPYPYQHRPYQNMSSIASRLQLNKTYILPEQLIGKTITQVIPGTSENLIITTQNHFTIIRADGSCSCNPTALYSPDLNRDDEKIPTMEVTSILQEEFSNEVLINKNLVNQSALDEEKMRLEKSREAAQKNRDRKTYERLKKKFKSWDEPLHLDRGLKDVA